MPVVRGGGLHSCLVFTALVAPAMAARSQRTVFRLAFSRLSLVTALN